MDEIINLNKEWFESFFEALNPWSESFDADHKIAWVRCYGLPIPPWNKECL